LVSYAMYAEMVAVSRNPLLLTDVLKSGESAEFAGEGLTVD